MPNNPMDLIDPPEPPFTEIDGWEMEFARYQWFYLPGYRRLMNEAGIYDISTVKSFVDQAFSAVPRAWIDAIPNGDWGSLAENQIERAVIGKTLCLEKALLAAVCLNCATTSNKAKKNINIFSVEYPISIRPALFLINGFDDKFYKKYIAANNQIIISLRKASAQKKPDVFEYMARGYAVTCRTATKTCEVLAAAFSDATPAWDQSRINILERRAKRKDREGRTLPKKPNQYETIPYP